MKTSKFTDEQIALALRQADLGTPVIEICRKMCRTPPAPGLSPPCPSPARRPQSPPPTPSPTTIPPAHAPPKTRCAARHRGCAPPTSMVANHAECDSIEIEDVLLLLTLVDIHLKLIQPKI